MAREELSADGFDHYIGKSFQLSVADTGLPRGDVVLTRVMEKTADPNLEQFAVIFQGPKSWLAPEGIYTLENAEAGNVTLLLVPVVGPDSDHHYYKAMFTRLRSESADW